jgi:peptidoglycan hydrolase CwlO-like protein
VRITPGFTTDQGTVIKSLLVGVGQDLTHFATNIIQEHTKAQHQVGELRVQYEKAQKELLSRRHQITDLQEQYKSVKKSKIGSEREIQRLEETLAESKAEVKRLQKLAKTYDTRHAKQVQARYFPIYY